MNPESERPIPTGPFPWRLAALLGAAALAAVAYVWSRPVPGPVDTERAARLYDFLTERARSLPEVAPARPSVAEALDLPHQRPKEELDQLLERFARLATVDALTERLLDRWSDLDPDFAVEVGLSRSPRLTRYTREYVSKALTLDTAGLASLRKLDPDRSTVDARLLGGLLERSILVHMRQGDLLNDPRPALWGIQACYTLLAPMEEADDESWRIVGERLAQAPEVILEFRDVLKDPPALWIELTLKDLEGTAAFLDQCRDAVRGKPGDLEARVGGSARRARDSLEAYAEHLRTLLPRAGPVPPGRPVDVSWRFRAFEFSPRPPRLWIDLLLEECTSSVDRYDELMETTSRIPRREMSFAEYLEAFPARIEWARDFTERNGIASVPEGHPLRVTLTPAHLRSWDSAALYATQTLAASPRPLMMVTPWKNHDRVTQTFSENYLKLVALHETWPGHHLHDVRTRLAGASQIRRLYPSNWLQEGWATYCERLAFEGELSSDPVEHANWFWQRNQLAWQSILEICLEAGTITEDEAVEFLTVCIGYEKPDARIQVAHMTLYPLHTTGYLLGERAILELRDELREKLGDRFSLRKFHERLLAYGRTPVALVREDLLRSWK